MNDDNRFFNVFGCGHTPRHTHTWGVVLHRFPSPLNCPPSLNDTKR